MESQGDVEVVLGMIEHWTQSKGVCVLCTLKSQSERKLENKMSDEKKSKIDYLFIYQERKPLHLSVWSASICKSEPIKLCHWNDGKERGVEFYCVTPFCMNSIPYSAALYLKLSNRMALLFCQEILFMAV